MGAAEVKRWARKKIARGAAPRGLGEDSGGYRYRWSQAEMTGCLGEARIESCQATAQSGLSQVQRIGEIQSLTVPFDSLTEGCGAVDRDVFDRKHVVEYSCDILSWHIVGTP